MNCPGVNTLMALTTGSLAPEVAQRIRLHVTGCAACRAALAEIQRAPLDNTLQASPEYTGAARPALRSGSTIGPYRLDQMIGRGGVGVIWAATHEDGHRVAIKVLLTARADIARRLRREARVTMSIHHPNLVRVRGVVEAGSPPVPAIVMELLHGEDLAARLATRGPLLAAEAMGVFRPIADALTSIHARGFVHRDLKPANVFLHAGDSGEEVKVLDLGVAGPLDLESTTVSKHRLTAKGAIVGTLRYMAPEQLTGKAPLSDRVDTWAMGVMLFEALSGKHPVRARGLANMLTELSTGPTQSVGDVCHDLPPTLISLVDACLNRSASGRPSATELRDALTSAS